MNWITVVTPTPVLHPDNPQNLERALINECSIFDYPSNFEAL